MVTSVVGSADTVTTAAAGRYVLLLPILRRTCLTHLLVFVRQYP